MSPVGHAVSSSQDPSNCLVDREAQHSHAALLMPRNATGPAARPTETLWREKTGAKPKSLRMGIKVRGKILFINLCDVISVRAKGKCVWLQQNAGAYLLRESISVVAEALEPHGFVRIHRSVLVNSSFVEEIRPLSTGEYCLRVDGGKDYTVTRTYKKNLKSLAQLWIGTGAFFFG